MAYIPCARVNCWTCHVILWGLLSEVHRRIDPVGVVAALSCSALWVTRRLKHTCQVCAYDTTCSAGTSAHDGHVWPMALAICLLRKRKQRGVQLHMPCACVAVLRREGGNIQENSSSHTLVWCTSGGQKCAVCVIALPVTNRVSQF
jgi:hypothetical protein